MHENEILSHRNDKVEVQSTEVNGFQLLLFRNAPSIDIVPVIEFIHDENEVEILQNFIQK